MKLNSLPSKYIPFKEIEIGTNRLINGQTLFIINGFVPLIVGVGEVPRVWISVPADPAGIKWRPLVRDNRSTDERVVIRTTGNFVIVSTSGTEILRVEKKSENFAKIESIDLRPFGINVYGDKKTLSIMNKSLSGNLFENVKAMVAIGRESEHVDIVSQGSEAIEIWRAKNLHIRFDLQGVNLRRADLVKANLNDADLRAANLEWADLRWADLINADLSEANLSRADFHKADLTDAKLQKVNLSNTNFEDANLFGADLNEASFFHTRLINTDLSGVKGLNTSQHIGPSIIDQETLEKSGYLSTEFLRGCGLSDATIRAAHAYDKESLLSSIESKGQFHSCFISYSTQDHSIAEKLYEDLQKHDVRCWFAQQDMRIGDKILDSIFDAIRKQEKVLLILSGNSVKSSWVEDEVTRTFNEERDRQDTVIFPIRIDDAVMTSDKAWAKKIRDNRHIGDFRNWHDSNAYRKAFERLIRDLKK